MMSRLSLLLVLGCSVIVLLNIVPWLDADATQLPKSSTTRTIHDFGVTGDGKTDDTAALQRAINAGGDIHLPKGEYRITKPIVVNVDQVGLISISGSSTARILMEGAGPAIQFMGTHRGTADPSTVDEIVWQRQRMPTVTGIEIVGKHPKADGIEATGTMMLTISRVLVRNTRHGIHLTKRNRNVIISDCHLYKNSGSGLYLDAVNLHQINVSNSHISYNGGGGIVVHKSGVCNLQITGCDIEANMAKNGPPAANVWIDTLGKSGATAEITIVGCTIQHTHAAPGSANIRIHGTELKKRVAPDNVWGNITIGDNVLSDSQFNIDIRNARGVSITGNTMWRGYNKNLQVEDSSNIVVGPNIFDRNPKYYWGGKPEENGLLFRNCEDVTLTGLHLNDVRQPVAGMILEDCRRVNMTNCTILDCENTGLLLKNVTDSRVSDCLIRNDKPNSEAWVSLKIVGGERNMIKDNLLGSTPEIDPQTGQVSGNVVHKKSPFQSVKR